MIENIIPPPAYLRGHSSLEMQRLIRQAGFFTPATEQLFRTAGIEPGMRVLDVGSGAGDVAFAAAKLVGPTGKVVGIDNALKAVDLANARVREQRLLNVTFVHEDIYTFRPECLFDAVVGRFVLVHQADPVASLRHLANYARLGALIVFQEFDFPAELLSIPRINLYHEVYRWILEAARHIGWDLHLGLKLRSVFTRAGLTAPKMSVHTQVEAGPDSEIYDYLADTLAAFLPVIQQIEIADPREVRIDTLAERLRKMAVTRQAVLMSPSVIGAWTRK